LQVVDAQRPRVVQGLVGDYTVRRAYYRCADHFRSHTSASSSVNDRVYLPVG
jgi:hypothetical protein